MRYRCSVAGGSHSRTGSEEDICSNCTRGFSYPVACLVLMLVGVPLGVISRRGGKSSGFVFTVLLVLLYYILSYTGIALSRQGKLPPVPRRLDGQSCSLRPPEIFLLWQMASGGRVLSAISSLLSRTSEGQRLPIKTNGNHLTELLEKLQPRSVRIGSAASFLASWMRTWCASSSECLSWCWPASSC